jgi:hypothetical protein
MILDAYELLAELGFDEGAIFTEAYFRRLKT